MAWLLFGRTVIDMASWIVSFTTLILSLHLSANMDGADSEPYKYVHVSSSETSRKTNDH